MTVALRRPGILFVLLIVAQVLLVSAQVQSKSGVRVLELVTFGVFSRVQAVTASVVRGVEGVWGGYFALRGVRAENTSLRQQVADLQVRLQAEHALAERSRTLQQLLALKTSATLPTLAADVIAGNPNPDMRTITIDRGSAEGVQPDMAVIAPSGVVGRVVGSTAAHAARVQLIIDRNAAAGAIIERTRAGGMVTGSDESPSLRMDLVSNLADVKPGDRVVTSGVDGIYPNGFMIGTVASAERGGGLYLAITVRPAVDFTSLEDVLVVLTPPRPAERVEAAK
jgi:rod shape-determining protein MreC